MKILVDYEKSSGYITTEDGCAHFIGQELSFTEHKEPISEKAGLGIPEMIQLKKAGFTAQEIGEMKMTGVL